MLKKLIYSVPALVNRFVSGVKRAYYEANEGAYMILESRMRLAYCGFQLADTKRSEPFVRITQHQMEYETREELQLSFKLLLLEDAITLAMKRQDRHAEYHRLKAALNIHRNDVSPSTIAA